MILNLTDGFEPFGGFSLDHQRFNFPSGIEPHIKIQSQTPNEVKIVCRIQTMNDLFAVFLANDALRRAGVFRVELFIPYLPFARQDRVMVKGEPLSIKVLADLINLQKFDKVQIFDVHSDVALALIDKSENITNHDFVAEVVKHREDYILVSPDAGAYKKIFKLAQFIGYRGEISVCNKTREVSTGDITGIYCDVLDYKGKDVFIIDDICDGGGTFVLLADELRKRNCGKINLVVSHGIFSKGTTLKNIDHIYTTDSFQNLQETETLTPIKLNPNKEIRIV